MLDVVKASWLWMFEFPWKDSGPDKRNHWRSWALGWLWAIAGLALGAFVASYLIQDWRLRVPPLLQHWGLSNASYQDAIVIAVSFFAGILVQVLSWSVAVVFAVAMLFALVVVFVRRPFRSITEKDIPAWVGDVAYVIGVVVALVVSLGGVGYALYRYFTWVGPGQAQVTIGFVGGLFLKAIIIPSAWGFLKSAAFKRVMDWLRGKKPTASKPS